MANTLTFNIAMEKTECWKCGGIYALTARFDNKRKEDGNGWHCPYCMASTVYRKSDLDKLRDELKRAENHLSAERARHDQTKASLTAQKAATTRLRNRAKNGVCPCCHRHFTNVERHMKTKHPDFEVEIQ